jgi:hypothetical protein
VASSRIIPTIVIKFLRILGSLVMWLVAIGCVAWAAGAVAFDLPWAGLRMGAAIGFVGCVIATVFLAPRRWKVWIPFAAFVAVLAWWLTLRPSDHRQWQPDVDRTAWAEINGDEVTFHNVRNCEYRAETDYTPRWETRKVRISQLTGLDLPITYWGSPWMAHPIASFQFADAPPVCFSIETRKEIGESYSAIGGLYRQFELIYIVADERDVVRLRTNYRKGEDVYFYRLTLNPDQVRERFSDYLEALNRLHERPRWYNAVTTNCTTSIRDQHASTRRTAWSWRVLLNGKMDESMFAHGTFVTDGLPFEELKKRSRINPAAQAANDAPDFSQRIRANLPARK